MSDGRLVEVRKAFTSSFIAKIIGAVVAFGALAVFTRTFSVSGIGTIYAVMAGSFALTAVSRGVFTSAKKRISEINTNNGQFVSIAILFHVGFSLVAFFPFVAAAVIQPLGIAQNLYVYGYLLMVAVGLFDALSDTYAGAGFPDRAAWLDSFRTVAGVAVQLALIALSAGLQSIIVGEIIGAVAAILLTGYLYRPDLTWPSKAALSSAAEFAKWECIKTIVEEVSGNSTIAIAGFLLGGFAAGQYKTVRSVGMPLLFFSSSLASPLAVRVSAEDSNDSDASDSIEFALVAVGLLSIPAFVGAIVIGDQLVLTAFGQKYSNNGLLLAILLFAMVAKGIDDVLESLLFGFDKPSLSTKAEVLYSVILVVLLVIGGLQFGVVGFVSAVAIGSWLAVIFKAVALYQVDSSILSIPRAVLSEVVAAALMGLAVWGGTMLIQQTTPIATISLVALGGVVYTVVLLLISQRVRQLLRRTRGEMTG